MPTTQAHGAVIAAGVSDFVAYTPSPERSQILRSIRRASLHSTVPTSLLLEGQWSRTDELLRLIERPPNGIAPAVVYVATEIVGPDFNYELYLVHRASIPGRLRTHLAMRDLLSALGQLPFPPLLILDTPLDRRRLESVCAEVDGPPILFLYRTDGTLAPSFSFGECLAVQLRQGPSWRPEYSARDLCDALIVAGLVATDVLAQGFCALSELDHRVPETLLWSEGHMGPLLESDKDRLLSSNAGSREDAIQELTAALTRPADRDEAHFHLLTLASPREVEEVRSSAIRTLRDERHEDAEDRLVASSMRLSSAELGLSWIAVDAGKFSMGSDATDWESLAEEQPAHDVQLNRFLIGRAPVTADQYVRFLESDSSLRAEAVVPSDTRLPMTRVNWYEANRFATWVGACLELAGELEENSVVRLPTEAEWERAARGTDRRIFPWGNTFSPRRCNVRTTGIGQPTVPGRFSPDGDSPVGCQDMAGNVWEWTASIWGESSHYPDYQYPYQYDDGRENAAATDTMRRVVRGGAYYYFDNCVRCATRNFFFPWTRHSAGGFRLAIGRPLGVR